ncbi:MAG: hypothetical protein PVH46_01650 [Granulosicoccaceae bacterium]|jgi:hypothetical protein
MVTDERQLTLIVPLHAAQDNAACTWLREYGEEQLCGRTVEPLSSLAALLTRADAFPLATVSLQHTLCELFAVRAAPSLPVAALNWLADTGEPATQPLLCLDPVHLLPDMDHVLLYDSTHFQIEQDEAQQLVTDINKLLHDDGLQVIAPTPQRWYLQGKAAGNTRFTPLADVVGRNILPAMPTGDDAAWWRHVLNEIQMLLHSHPVNEKRVTRGFMPINGVWPWGNGEPEQTGHPAYSSCSSNDVFVKGLSRLQQIEYRPLPEDFTAWLAQAGSGAHLVHLPLVAADDAAGLCNKLAALERDWLVPLATAMQDAALQRCTFYLGGQHGYTLTMTRYKGWWRRLLRRQKTIVQFCQQENAA